MNQELKAMGQLAQAPELSTLLNKFEQLNMEISELTNEIAYRLNAIKTFPVGNLTEIGTTEKSPEDVLSHLDLQLSNLTKSKHRLEDCFNHIKTIV